MPGMDPGLLPLMYPGLPGLMGPGMPPIPPGLMPGQFEYLVEPVLSNKLPEVSRCFVFLP